MEILTAKKQSLLDFVQVFGQENVLSGKELVQEQERTSIEFEKNLFGKDVRSRSFSSSTKRNFYNMLNKAISEEDLHENL